MARFRILIKPAERDEIFLKHLIVEGIITEAERAHFKQVDATGSGKHFVEFEVESPLDEHQ